MTRIGASLAFAVALLASIVAPARVAYSGSLLSRRACLRSREERPDSGLRRTRRQPADGVCRSAPSGQRLLRPRPARFGARPGVPDRALRLRPLHTRRRDRRHCATLGERERRRRLSEPAWRLCRWLRRQREALTSYRRARLDGRQRENPRRRLVSAVLGPLDWRSRV